MNEFTKEELMSLKFCIEIASIEESSILDSRKQLLAKIQSMIDNYCEHKEKYEDHDDSVDRCKTCGVVVNE